jgi:hypothetical protein
MSDDYIDWEKAARKYNIEIGEKDATIARLTRELEEARGMCDLYVDEFHRIIAIADNSEIKGLCERAVFGIKQRIPLIEQRDNLEAENAALREEVERSRSAEMKTSITTMAGWHEVLEAMGRMVQNFPAHCFCQHDVDVLVMMAGSIKDKLENSDG